MTDWCTELGATLQAERINKYYKKRGIQYEVYVKLVNSRHGIWGLRSENIMVVKGE